MIIFNHPLPVIFISKTSLKMHEGTDFSGAGFLFCFYLIFIFFCNKKTSLEMHEGDDSSGAGSVSSCKAVHQH